MPDTYPIFQFDAVDLERDETMGNKVKYWFRHGDERWLYKEGRENTGEDWSEKLGSEIASLLDIPAARVELAEYAGKRGCASLSFVNPKEGALLIHGNEVLAGQVLGYDKDKVFHQSDHTLDNIRAAISKMFPDPDVHHGVLTELCSYLVLDALIGNTDRHHQNWGLLMVLTLAEGHLMADTLQVAPSYDHASSLGRELRDEKRASLLASNAVASYVRKGRGAVFFKPSDNHGANPLRLVEYGALKFSEYFSPGLERLRLTTLNDLNQTVDRVPGDRMSPVTREFTKAFLAYTYGCLCNLLK